MLPAGGPAARAVGRPTLHGGPVVLRPVRATPCLICPGNCFTAFYRKKHFTTVHHQFDVYIYPMPTCKVERFWSKKASLVFNVSFYMRTMEQLGF